MRLKACINGARRPSEHPAIPVSADQMTADVSAVAAAGADGVHLHVKDDRGADTLAAQPLARVLDAVRERTPGLPIGVTTGAWALPDPAARVAAIRSWDTRPDFASVNWHEGGAEEVARALLDQGIEVEAGLWHEAAVDLWARSPVRDDCVRVLLELPDGPDPAATVAIAQQLLARARRVTDDRVSVLLHGEGSSCWPALREAARLELPTRIGLEDTLMLPDGSRALDNAALVAAALRLIDAEKM